MAGPKTKPRGRRTIAILSGTAILIFGVMIWVFACMFACIYIANIPLGIVSIAFPPPEKVAKQYFEAILAGDIDAVQDLTAKEGSSCKDLALEMAQQHIGQFGGSEVIDVNIAAGYWDEAATDFSPAHKQISSVTFKFRKPGESEWRNGVIRFNIWQFGWRYVVCGSPP